MRTRSPGSRASPEPTVSGVFIRTEDADTRREMLCDRGTEGEGRAAAASLRRARINGDSRRLGGRQGRILSRLPVWKERGLLTL